MKHIFNALVVCAVLFGLNSCKEEPPVDDAFNRNALLTHMADELIIPGFSELTKETNSLVQRLEKFIKDPNINSLNSARSQWWNTYQIWLRVNSFNFGPAGEDGLTKSLLEEIGTFPVNTVAIESRISANDTNTLDFSRDTRGFLAIDYLLFGTDSSNIVSNFQNDGRKQYLMAIARHIQKRIDQVHYKWNSGYRNTFLNANGSDAGSSVSQMYNAFVMSFESIKNFKLGIPLGLRPGQTNAEPDKVECRFSGKGAEAIELHLNALMDVYNGVPFIGNAKNLGFRDYLMSVYGGEELVGETIPSYNSILEQISLINKQTPLNESIVNEPQPLIDLHNALQQHTRFFKSDMSSLLGIAITFSSGDGD